MFYGLATNHEYWEERINLFVALAPVVKLCNTHSKFIKIVVKFAGVLRFFVGLFTHEELF